MPLRQQETSQRDVRHRVHRQLLAFGSTVCGGYRNPSQGKSVERYRRKRKKGKKLTDGLKEIAKDNGFDLRVTGEPGMFYLRLANDLPSRVIHQDWVCECVKRGVFFTSHHNHFINYALSNEDIQYTWEVADEAYKVVRERYPQAQLIK